MSENNFEMAMGSMVGARHLGNAPLNAGRNNQDALTWRDLHDGGKVLVVCDGCSAKSKSEVGSNFVAEVIAASIQEQAIRYDKLLSRPEGAPEFWRRIFDEATSAIRLAAKLMSGAHGSLTRTVGDYFMFTSMVGLILRTRSYVASCGDGFYAINGDVTEIESPKNKPKYMGYVWVPQDDEDHVDVEGFRVEASLPTSELEMLMVGSDGLKFLVDNEDKKIPGQEELVGPLSQFWTHPQYFMNKDAVRRRLALLTSDSPSIRDGRLSWERAILEDDTSLVIARRMK